MALVGVLLVWIRELLSRQTHENTMQHAYDAHKSRLEKKYAPVCGVKGYSWFMFIPGFDIIKGIAVDYMHCVLLGVTKTLYDIVVRQITHS